MRTLIVQVPSHRCLRFVGAVLSLLVLSEKNTHGDSCFIFSSTREMRHPSIFPRGHLHNRMKWQLCVWTSDGVAQYRREQEEDCGMSWRGNKDLLGETRWRAPSSLTLGQVAWEATKSWHRHTRSKHIMRNCVKPRQRYPLG